jgi:hypothetical protein
MLLNVAGVLSFKRGASGHLSAMILIGSPQHNAINFMGRGGSVCPPRDERAGYPSPQRSQWNAMIPMIPL